MGQQVPWMQGEAAVLGVARPVFRPRAGLKLPGRDPWYSFTSDH